MKYTWEDGDIWAGRQLDYKGFDAMIITEIGPPVSYGLVFLFSGKLRFKDLSHDALAKELNRRNCKPK